MNTGKAVFITGVGGYIGSTLALRCIQDGYRVVGYGHAKNFDMLRARIPQHLELIEGDVTDEGAVIDAMRGAYALIHTAGPTGTKACAQNEDLAKRVIVDGTRIVAKGAQMHRIARVIHCSTQAVYSTFRERPMPLYEHDELLPDEIYGKLKAAAEQEISHIPAMVLRMSNVYGLGAHVVLKTDVVGNFVTNALENSRVPVFGEGTQKVDFVHVDDVAGVVLGYIQSDAVQHGAFYNVSSGTGTTIVELARIVAEEVKRETGRGVPIIFQETPSGKIWPDRYISNNKLRLRFSWFPHTDLRSGIREMINYYSNLINK